MLYYTFEGYDSEKYNYYNCSGDFYFYIMNENSLKINASSVLENEIIYIDENESVILSVENLTYYNKYSRLNISIYIVGIDGAVGEFPVTGNYNNDLENYTLTFNSDAYPDKEYKVYAIYNGYSTSNRFISNATSNIITVIINQNTNISLKPSFIDVSYGESENIEVCLSDNIVEGNITFFDNSNHIECFVEVPLDTVFTTENLSVGNHIISVKYNGAKGFNSCISNISVIVRPYLYINIENSKYLDNLTAEIITSNNGNYTLKIKDQEYKFEITNYTKNVDLKTLPAGLDYNTTVTYDEDPSLISSVSFNITKIDMNCAVNVTGNNTQKGVSKSVIITVYSINADGNFTAVINNKKYTSPIINNVAVFTLTDLAQGSYMININYSGDDNYLSKTLQTTLKVSTATVLKMATKIIAHKQTFKVKKSKKYTVLLKTKTGKAVVKVKLTLKVKGKTYSTKTNKKGKATFNLKKLNKKGTYKAKIQFRGNAQYNSSSKTVKIKVK